MKRYMNRQTHRFRYLGQQIAAACTAEVEYHEERIRFWENARDGAIAACKSAGFTVKEHAISGGKRAEMVIDQTFQRRVDEAVSKVSSHQSARDRYRIEAGAYGAQPSGYFDLDPDDVVYFRLAGGSREE
jgi:hypothetical protein